MSTVGHERRNVSIRNSPAIFPLVLLLPNSPASSSSSATPVVPILISPGKSAASAVPAGPPSVVIHLGLVPVEVVLLLHRSSELVRMFFLIDSPPNLWAGGVPGGVMIYVSPAEKTLKYNGENQRCLTYSMNKDLDFFSGIGEIFPEFPGRLFPLLPSRSGLSSFPDLLPPLFIFGIRPRF